MRRLRIDPGDRVTILVHYYRAMVGRADIWRMRIDTTTNWAIGATAAVVSFSLGSPGTPHYVLLVAPLLSLFFLSLEARRLTFYHLWQRRVLWLEDALVRPALSGDASAEAAAAPLGARESDPVGALEAQLATTIPVMSRFKAAARRLRRIYLYVLGFQILAWGLKLASHPGEVASLAEVVERARVGLVPGPVVVGGVLGAFVLAAGLARIQGGPDRSGVDALAGDPAAEAWRGHA